MTNPEIYVIVAYIACLFSNNEKDFVWRKIERDLDEEENNILLLQDFWDNNVLARVEPEFTEKPDMVLDALRRYYGPADSALPTVEIDPSYLPSLLQIADLRAQKSILESQARKLEEQIKVAYVPFAEQLGNACAAVCQGNSQRVTITYNPQYREGISKEKLNALKAQYPDIYDDFVETTESRVFKIKKQDL